MRFVARCKNALLVLVVSLACALGVPSTALAAGSVDSSGKEVSASETADATKPTWDYSGVRLSATRVTSGQSVIVEPQVSGDLDGATYNYVWQRGGSWADGDWGSTVRDTGRGTSDASATLSSEVSRAGTYTIYVDVTDRSGVKRTMSAEL